MLTADYSCLGTGTLPTPGDDVTFTADLMPFNPVESASRSFVDVEIYADDEITASDCGVTSCTSMTTDDVGELSLTLPEDSRFAYRVLETTELVETLGFHEVAVASETVRLDVLSKATLAIVGAPAAGMATVSVRVTDCAGVGADGAVVRLYDSSTRVCAASYLYPRSGSVDLTHRWTGSGSFAAAAITDVPVPPDGELVAEAWGRLTEGGPLELLGREIIFVREGVHTAVTLGPLRADSPSR